MRCTIKHLMRAIIWPDFCDASALNSPLGADEAWREIEGIFDAYPRTHRVAVVDPELRDIFDAVAAKQKQPIVVMTTPTTLREAITVADILPHPGAPSYFSTVREHRGLSLDLTQNVISFEGKEAKLRPQQSLILNYYMLNAGWACGRDELLHAIYPDTGEAAEGKIIEVRISELNKTLNNIGFDASIRLEGGEKRGWTFDAGHMRQIVTEAHDFTFYSDASISVCGHTLKLPLQEDELLGVMLASEPDAYLSYDNIFARTSIPDRDGLKARKTKLLKKINAVRENLGLKKWNYIQNVWGKGLKFCPTPEKSPALERTPFPT